MSFLKLLVIRIFNEGRRIIDNGEGKMDDGYVRMKPLKNQRTKIALVLF